MLNLDKITRKSKDRSYYSSSLLSRLLFSYFSFSLFLFFLSFIFIYKNKRNANEIFDKRDNKIKEARERIEARKVNNKLDRKYSNKLNDRIDERSERESFITRR